MSDGVLYVEILPSTKGIGKAVEGDLNKQFKNAEKTGEGFFSRVGSWAKRGAIAVGGMVAAVGALAVGGGISRALNIEDAQAKLKGLGHDTQSVEAIMKDALASVKGTAFGLDAAATTAAAAVASGIKPGKELEGYLRLTADAATIAGVSMEEMGSIMNKVQAKGKAQMEDLNRLTERGIPIMQMLADEYGVTAEEMSKMVSRGEVDAERFRAALEKNVGGAALESGNTTRGAFKNMMAALSRLGLVFVEDGVAGAKTFFNEVTVILDGIAERVKPWVASINEALGGAFSIDGFGERFLAGFDKVVSAIASGPIPQMLAALQPILPVILEVAQTIGGALGAAFREIGEALTPVLPEVAKSLADAVIELAPSLSDLLVALLPLIPPLVDLLVALLPIATGIVDFLLPALRWLVEWVTGNFESFSLFFDLLSGESSLTEFATKMMSLGGPFGAVMNWLGDIAFQFGYWAASVGIAVGNALSFVSSLPARIRSALASLPGLLVGVGRQMIQGLIDGVGSMVSSAVAAVKNVGGQMLDGVKSFLGIHSPSRVFRDQVGKMVGLGLLAGIEDQAISARIDTAVNHLVSVPGDGARTASAGVQVVVQGNVYGDPDHVGEAIDRKARRAQAAYETRDIK